MSTIRETPTLPVLSKKIATDSEEPTSVERGEAVPSQEPYGRCLAENPLWPELLAEIAANRQASLERDAQDYAE